MTGTNGNGAGPTVELSTLRGYVGYVRPLGSEERYKVRSPSARIMQAIERLYGMGKQASFTAIGDVVAQLVPAMPREVIDDMSGEELGGIILMAVNPTVAAQRLAGEALERISPKDDATPTTSEPASTSPATPMATSATASPLPLAGVGGTSSTENRGYAPSGLTST